MAREDTLTQKRLRTPRPAAIAGIIFSLLMMTIVAMLFALAAIAGGLLSIFAIDSRPQLSSDVLMYSRAITYSILYVYGMKTAGVFMISTATVGLRSGAVPRWLGWLGYLFAAVLLLSIIYWELMTLLFPLWILMLSVYTLAQNYRHKLPASFQQR